jgi:hypothetical protein
MPWAVIYVAIFAWWVSWYFLAPLLFPLTAYMFSDGWTVFSLDRMGWPINIVYSILVAAIATWLGRMLTLRKAIAVYAGTVVSGAVVVHAVMAALGYRYWYDTP